MAACGAPAAEIPARYPAGESWRCRLLCELTISRLTSCMRAEIPRARSQRTVTLSQRLVVSCHVCCSAPARSMLEALRCLKPHEQLPETLLMHVCPRLQRKGSRPHRKIIVCAEFFAAAIPHTPRTTIVYGFLGHRSRHHSCAPMMGDGPRIAFVEAAAM